MTEQEEILQKQYDRLIAARNYHYDNLNKWLMSFYVIIGALFIAFYSIDEVGYKTIVAVIGYIVSLAALLSGKGYYYWEYIWINKLYRFEKNVLNYSGDKQVYSSIINKDKYDIPCCPIKSANISTTQVALFVTFGVTVGWGFIIGMLYFGMNFAAGPILISLGVSIIATFLLMRFCAWLFQSELGGLDELPSDSDLHKTYHAKGICMTVFLVIAIVTSFAVVGYMNGKYQAIPTDITTAPDSVALLTPVNETLQKQQVEIIVKQNTGTNSHKDVLFGIGGTLIGAILGAVLGAAIAIWYDKRQTRKRKGQYVKEIQLITNAILEHTVDCNYAISKCIESIKQEPYMVAGLKQGIVASIERLTRLDANLVYEAFESVGKETQFNKFLNLFDQLLTQYTGVYAYNERNDQTIITYTKEFEELQLEIIQHLRDTQLKPELQALLTAYNTAKLNAKVPIDLRFIHKELIVPAFRTSSNPLTHDSVLYTKTERANYLYNTICTMQISFASILQRLLLQIHETIKLIEKIKL